MREFRIGIVGTGNIARLHAENLAKLGGRARIVAAMDVDQERLDAYRSRWEVPSGYRDLEELLSREGLDVVHLCTPPGAHREQAMACLAAGVNVLCEKPPTLSLAEMDEIAEAEAAYGARFATVFQHRFGSAAVNLRRLVADGALGRPLVAVCDTLWYRPDKYFEVPWRGNWENEGGGPTMGHGIHQFDLLLSVLGEWSQLTAMAARQARPTETEDLSCALVRFANGAMATVTNSLLSPRETSYLRFDFERATVEVEHLYGYRDDDWTVTPAPGHEDTVTKAWESGLVGVSSGHAAQFAAVLDAIEEGTPPPVTSAQARTTLEMVAATYASAFTGQAVRAGELDRDNPHYHRMKGAAVPWTPAPADRTTQELRT